MKRLVVVVGLVIFLASGAVLGESKDYGCPNQAAVSRVESLRTKCEGPTPAELPEPEVQTEGMEWQCIYWWECVHYETRNCDPCYSLCITGCVPVCAIGGFWWGVACAVGCPMICEACPDCEYCDDWEQQHSCGWVFTE